MEATHRQKCWEGARDDRVRDWDDWMTGIEWDWGGKAAEKVARGRGGACVCRDEATRRSIGGVGRDTQRVDGRRGQGTLVEPVWR